MAGIKINIMNLKLIRANPVTCGLRHVRKLNKNLLSKLLITDKNLLKTVKKSQGRNSKGRITAWHRGGRGKITFRNLNGGNLFSKNICVNITYDPFRTAFVSNDFDIVKKVFKMQLSTLTRYPGSYSVCSDNIKELSCNFRTKLQNIPSGSLINNLNIKNSYDSKYIKSSGTFGVLLQKDYDKAILRLPSKKLIKVSSSSYATIGVVSNEKNNLVVLGKAGSSRNYGRRPMVRGIAMNPVDHPHGGKTNGGRPSVSPWGLPTKNKFILRKK